MPETGTLTLQRRAAGGGGGAGAKNEGASEAALEIRLAWQHGIPVEGVVSGINKGGAEVQVKGVRCLLPAFAARPALRRATRRSSWASGWPSG